MSKSYIAKLRAEAEAVNLLSEKAKANPHGTDSRILCDTSLVDQIDALMRSLPPAQRDRPWSMEEFCCRLKGRYSPRPHPMKVGEALRALGWTQRRLWGRYGGRRLWHLNVP